MELGSNVNRLNIGMFVLNVFLFFIFLVDQEKRKSVQLPFFLPF